MPTPPLRFRQVHLDFHTSEAIPHIGANFDPDAFVDTLVKARVNSITCFARCHHGWLYYDSQAFPERRHPHLARNLLKEQIEACHARNIRVPIYITVQWDHFTARQHPEWLAVDPDGQVQGTPPFEAGFYRNLCVNSPYLDFLKAHTREVLETLPVDGIFFDIVKPLDDASVWTMRGMEDAGLNPSDPEARYAYAVQVINDFKSEMSAFVRQFQPDCTIFYNAGHVGVRQKSTSDAYSHFELESLPSGGWGYLHFPVSMRYARTLGHDCLGMTGKFHTSWGDFHSYKNQAALEFECFQMLALNARCSVGDQLPPDGKLDGPTYDLIGRVFHAVEEKEPWCEDAVPVTEIGVFNPEAFYGEEVAGRVPPAAAGATRMLQEGGHQFDLLDAESELGAYKVLVLPDIIPVNAALADRLQVFLDAGGAIIASFESGLRPDKRNFALDALGVRLNDPDQRDPQGNLVRGRSYDKADYIDYLRPEAALGRNLAPVEHAMYMRGLRVTAAAGAEILAQTIQSYFDRTYAHFCSHRQTPSSGEVVGPAVVQQGQVIYFSHPIFGQYEQNAPRWCKTLFLNALQRLLPQPLLRHTGPSTLLTAINAQPEHERWILHLLHYIPERRGREFDILEDVIPLFDVPLSLKIPAVIKSIKAVPQHEVLAYQQVDGRVNVSVPRLDGHQMLEIQFES